MAEFFCVFFTKLSPLTLRKRTFSYGSRFLKNLSKEVLNNGFNNYTACFEIRIPPFTAGVGNLRPAKAFHPAHDLLLSSGQRPVLFFNDRYAAINRRNDSLLLAKTFFCVLRHRFVFFFLFWSSPSTRPKKGMNCWRKPFFCSAGIVMARWNLVRTKCGPLVQKVTDPRFTTFLKIYEVFFIRLV